jgi:hypothetical protein
MAIIVPGDNSKKDTKREDVVEYAATETDEEVFMLASMLHISPDVSETWTREKRRWYIGRYIYQQRQEQEMMMQQHLAQQIMPNIKG